MAGFVALLEAEVYCPDSFSLKDKRSSVHGIIDRLEDRYNVSVAEVANQDHHRLSTLLVAVVASDRKHLDRVIARIEKEIVGFDGTQLRSLDVDLY
jgi:hypothetical protein